MTEAYTQHPVRELLNRLLDLEHERALFEPEVSSNQVAAHGRDKTFAYCKLFKDQFDNTPALYASIHTLNQVHGVLQQIYNEFTAYVSNHNIGHLNNAAAYVDQSLVPLYTTLAWYSASPGSRDSAGSLAIDTLESHALKSAQRFRELHQAVESSLAASTVEIERQEARLAEMSTTVAAQKADAASVVATVTKEYAESEAKRSANYIAQAQDMEDRFGKLITKLDADTTEVLKRLAQHQSDAERIVQVVGNVGITGNYQKIARSENTQANIWRLLTLGFFALGVLLAVLTFLKFYEEPFHAEHTLTVAIRLLFAIAITAPAWYTAKESARHRTNSDRARQTELELASLGPFIELMPQEKKDSIREELSKKYFANKIEEHSAEPPISTKDLKEVAIEAIKALKG
jgi:VIT1/CCC1 family predicted Fe2+/Mn2+ transporter